MTRHVQRAALAHGKGGCYGFSMVMDLKSAQSASDYAAADPFPHIVIDDAFPAEQLREVAREVEALELRCEREFYGTSGKQRLSEASAMPPATRTFIEQLQGPEFLRWLEGVSGIEGLVFDPELEGGGVHRIMSGGFLKIHADSNWSTRLQLHRRLNLILYLNPDWRDEWGGALEFWRRDMSACARRIAPVFNRMVIFSTTAISYHGHPEPLRCPEPVTRNSIALYYYAADRPAEEIAGGPTILTDYRQRPGERFGGVAHRRHRLMLKLPFLRRLLRR